MNTCLDNCYVCVHAIAICYFLWKCTQHSLFFKQSNGKFVKRSSLKAISNLAFVFAENRVHDFSFRLDVNELHSRSSRGAFTVPIDKGLMEMVCASSINVLILAIILAVTITMRVKIRRINASFVLVLYNKNHGTNTMSINKFQVLVNTNELTSSKRRSRLFTHWRWSGKAFSLCTYVHRYTLEVLMWMWSVSPETRNCLYHTS